MTRYFFVILIMALIGVAIVVKAGVTMFAERQYWQDVADRFVKENVTVKPNRGNIISSDGKLMASSLPEYRIYMDFMSGEKDEKRRKKDQARRDSILKANMDSICIGLHKIFPDKSAAQFKAHLQKGRQAKSRNYLIYPKRISYIQYKEVKRLPVFCLNRYKGGFKELAYNQRKKPFGSLAARTLGDVYADTAQGAKNGIELAFDTILKGRDGLTHRQKVMNKYLNIVDVAPIDGCDLITTIDVGMQDICEKALVDKLKELNATVGVVVLMEVTTGEVKAIVNMTQGRDGEYYEVRNNAISDMLEPGSTFKTASIMVALEDGKITPDYIVDTGNGQKPMHGRVMKDHKPKYSMIVSIQKPGLPASGGLMAGSVFSKIAERVYAKDLRLPLTSAIDTNTVVIPNVKAGEMRETQRVLEELNIKIQGKITDSGKEVWGSTHPAPQAVVLESRGIMQNFVPSVVGMGAKDAVYLLESKGLKVNLVGVGKVKSQSIANGSVVKKGQTITLTMH